MANEILDDIDYVPEKDYQKPLKGVKKLFLISLALGVPSFAVTLIFSPHGFEKVANLPSGWAVPLVFSILGIAGVLMSFVLFKVYKYWSAKKKYHNLS